MAYYMEQSMEGKGVMVSAIPNGSNAAWRIKEKERRGERQGYGYRHLVVTHGVVYNTIHA